MVFSTALLGIHLAGIFLLGSFPHRVLLPILARALSAVALSLPASCVMEVE